MSAEIRRLLEEAFEAGHWAWPTPDHPTRASLREAAIDRILGSVPALGANPDMFQKAARDVAALPDWLK